MKELKTNNCYLSLKQNISKYKKTEQSIDNDQLSTE